jgi:protein TonB
MFENKRRFDGAVDTPDRRAHARVPLRSLAYLALDGGNGGVILNICEGGIAVQTAGIITDVVFPRMRFRLPQSETWIEAGGKAAWQGPSRKEAGIRFVALTEDAREQIKSWIDSVALDTDFPSELDHSRTVSESEELAREPQGFLKNDPLAEFDSMFPSETSLPPPTRRSRRGPDPAAPELDGSTEAAPTPPSSPPQELIGASPQSEPPAAADRAEEPPPPDSPRTAPSMARTSFYEEILATHPESASLHGSGMARVSGTAPAPKLESVAPSTGGIPFTGFGYQPVAFEEPTGEGWIVVVAALAVLLILGVVVSVGPAKLSALLFHRASAIPTPTSSEAAVAGPPPPYGATDENMAKPPNNTHSNPAHQPPKVPSASGALPESGTEDATIPEVDTQTVRGQAEDSSGTPQSAAEVQPDETPEEKEEKVRQFQLEHSATIPVMPPPVSQMPSSSQPQVVKPNPANPVPVSPRTERTSGASGPAGSSMPHTPAPTGTVAISSHFQSVPGSELQSTDSLQIGQLIAFREPNYPIEAVRERVEGTVTLRIGVNQVGTVESVRFISGPPLLAAAAINSVRTWRYRQTILNGRTVESVEDVAMTFRLGNTAASPR